MGKQSKKQKKMVCRLRIANVKMDELPTEEAPVELPVEETPVEEVVEVVETLVEERAEVVEASAEENAPAEPFEGLMGKIYESAGENAEEAPVEVAEVVDVAEVIDVAEVVEEVPAQAEEETPAEEKPAKEPIRLAVLIGGIDEEEKPVEEAPVKAPLTVEEFSKAIVDIKREIRKDVVGQDEIVDGVILAIIAGGNVLLEGVPGVGKTRLVRSMGRTLSLPFSRIQFTPDLMPSDVTGANVIEKDENGKMNIVFQKGPVFANLILADEINRATPKTQSSMLEVMQEHKITVSGQTYRMEEPFFVLATQNPVEQDGTYPLPEAQMDRFMFKLVMEFPSTQELMDIVNMTQITLEENATPIVDGETILEMRELAKGVPVMDKVLNYAVNLVTYTHPELAKTSDTAKKYLKYGASPRAAQALITCAKVRALMNGRYNVAYEDIDALACPVLRHRIKLNYTAVNEGLSMDDVIKLLVEENKKLSK